MLLKVNFAYFLEILASLAVIFPIIIGSITVKKDSDIPYKIVFLYCSIYLIFEIIGWYFVLHHWHNHFLHNTLAYVDIIVLGTYFYLILTSIRSKQIVISLSVIALLLTAWSHLGTGRDFNRIDSFALSVGNFSLIAMSLLFFYQLLNNLDVKNILTYSHFWIVVGLLLYFSGVFFSFIFVEYIAFSQDKNIIQYFQISAYLLFIQRIFLAIGLWFSKTPQQLSPSSK
jgi:hypothetical protein